MKIYNLVFYSSLGRHYQNVGSGQQIPVTIQGETLNVSYQYPYSLSAGSEVTFSPDSPKVLFVDAFSQCSNIILMPKDQYVPPIINCPGVSDPNNCPNLYNSNGVVIDINPTISLISTKGDSIKMILCNNYFQFIMFVTIDP